MAKKEKDLKTQLEDLVYEAGEELSRASDETSQKKALEKYTALTKMQQASDVESWKAYAETERLELEKEKLELEKSKQKHDQTLQEKRNSLDERKIKAEECKLSTDSKKSKWQTAVEIGKVVVPSAVTILVAGATLLFEEKGTIRSKAWPGIFPKK